MDKQVLTRRGLFVLGLVAIGRRAFASDEGHDNPRPRHRGYKVGGGMVLLVMAAVAGSMALFGEFRRNRAAKPAAPPPVPLPEVSHWDPLEDETAPEPDAAVTDPTGPRRRRTRRVHTAGHSDTTR